MIINYFDLRCGAIFKSKAQSPLLIDPEAPAAPTITGQFFKSVARRRLQKFNRPRAMQKNQLPFGLLTQGQKSPGTFASKQLLRIFASKGLDHSTPSILRAA
jgi:hypothetical protein